MNKNVTNDPPIRRKVHVHKTHLSVAVYHGFHYCTSHPFAPMITNNFTFTTLFTNNTIH